MTMGGKFFQNPAAMTALKIAGSVLFPSLAPVNYKSNYGVLLPQNLLQSLYIQAPRRNVIP